LAWFGPFNADAGSTPHYPLTETVLTTELDVYVAPWPVRGQKPRTWAFEPYALAGLGLLVERPVPVIDPTHRSFSDNHLTLASLGIGVRVFVARDLAVTLELRDFAYYDRIENRAVALGSPSLPAEDPNNPRNPSTWYSTSNPLANAVALRLGASFFVGL
jgi:hypothetical protein